MKVFLHIWHNGRLIIVSAFAFLVLGVMAFFTFNLSFLNPIQKVVQDFSMTDFYYQILMQTNRCQESSLITIVDITELTDRGDLALTLEEIEACNPKVIGVDVVFDGLKEDTVADGMLRDIAGTYDNIIWSEKLCDYADDNVGYTIPQRSFFAQETGCKEAVTNMQRSLYSGLKRILVTGWKLQGELLPSFVGMLANTYAEKTLLETRDDEIEINFAPTMFTVIPGDSVIYHPELIVDRIVLFGAMHEDADMHYTPLGQMAGIELLAYAVQTVLRGNEVYEVKGFFLVMISFLLVMLTSWGRTSQRRWIARRKRLELRLLLEFPVFKSIISFMWVILLMWAAFILFSYYDVSFSLGLAFSGIAFLGTAEKSYDTITKYLKNKGYEI